ncbi:MAG TPA: hypothetical protein VFA89_15740 [Terriglobales bacterium]|nr:hypothetical protein [Terriglobales bacterium]
MRSRATKLLVGFAFGAGLAALVRSLLRPQAPRTPPRARREPVSSSVSPRTFSPDRLTDLNSAGVAELRQLGLGDENIDRVIENRPYRNKLDLVSRMIVPEEVYETIKDKIAVANADESVKVA